MRLSLVLLCVFLLIVDVSAVKRMRFKKARQAGAYMQRNRPQYEQKESKSKSRKRGAVSPSAVKVCVPVSCGTGEAINTDCDMKSKKLACENVPEKKCTPISLNKACKVDKNVVYVTVERRDSGDKIYDVKSYKDVRCTKPSPVPTITVNCKTQNLNTNRYSCNSKDDMTIGALCKCNNCQDPTASQQSQAGEKIERKSTRFALYPLIILIAVGVFIYFIHKIN